MIKPAKHSAQRYFLASRLWNGAFVLVPVERIAEWDKFDAAECEAGEDHEIPEWAQEVDIDALTFTNPKIEETVK